MRLRSARAIAFAVIVVTVAGSARGDDDQKLAATTLKGMDSIATAIEAYMTDQDTSPNATSVEALRSLLVPTYMKSLSASDAWGTPFRYVKTGKESFRIISAGSDRKFDEKSWTTELHTRDFAADAVYEKGESDTPGKFQRIWTGELGGPLALTSGESTAATRTLMSAELEKMKGMSEEQSRSYLRTSGTTRTMQAFRTFLELYKQKNGAYPGAKSMTELAAALLPESAADVQTKDWWGTEFRYLVSSDRKSYRLVSAGADAIFNAASWDTREVLATADDDAVVRNGEFIRKWDEHTLPGETAESKRRKTLKPASRSLLERADTLYAAGDAAGALDAYMNAVKADPSAADLETIKRYGSIANYALAAPPPPPPPPPPRDARKVETSQAGDKSDAAEAAALRQYLALKPGDWDATQALIGRVELPEAESLLKPFFEARPRDPALYAVRGSVRLRSHQYSTGIADYVKASELDPQNAERYYSVGVVEYETVARETSLSTDQKRELIRSGLIALNQAEALKPDYVESMAYRNLLLRQQALLEKDPAVQQNLIEEAAAVRQRAVEIINTRRGAAAQPKASAGPLKVGGDVKAPVVINRVEPVYPEKAKKNGISGIVIVEAVIDKTGHVASAEAIKPLPFGVDAAVLDAVKQWTFRPGTLNGEPVDVIFDFTVRVPPPQ